MHKDCDKYYFKKPEFYRFVGESHYVRIDAEDRVMGHGQYVGDIMFPDISTGETVRSPCASARILSIDISKAGKLPDVKCILTARDFEWKSLVGNGEFAIEFANKEVFCSEKVRQVGDDMAAAVAVDEEMVQRAVDLIKVEYRALLGVFDPFEAMEEGVSEVNWEGKGLHNIGMQSVMKTGTDIDQEFDSAGYIQRRDCKTHRMVHAAIEPCGAVATFRNGTCTIRIPTQVSCVDQFWYTRCLSVGENQVRMIKSLVDGGLGGKLDSYSFGLCATKTSEPAGQPVRMTLSREEMSQTTHNHHPIYMYIDTVFGTDGKLLAKKRYHVLDGSPYGGSGVAACAQSTLWTGFPYKVNFVDFLTRRVYTNNPSAGAMRGYTACQVHFVHNLNMQFTTDQMGVDPVEFRRMGAADPGYMAPMGLAVTSRAYRETLNTIARETDWYDKENQMKKGENVDFTEIGLMSGAGFAVPGAPNQSFACMTLRMDKRGMAALYVGSHDIDQSSGTVMTAIAAEELGLPTDVVRTFMPDTFPTPWDPGLYESRATFLAGDTVRRATVDAKRQLFEAVTSMWGVMLETLECLDDEVISKENAKLQMSIGNVMLKHMTVKGGDKLVGIGSYYHHIDDSQYNGTNTTNYALAHGFFAGAAHLTVDEETGVLDIDEFVLAHDCGRTLNEKAVEDQLEGSIGMGLKYVVYKHDVTKEGKILNPNFRDYRLPTALDMPRMRISYDFTSGEKGPLDVKEAGKGSAAPVASTIASAVNMTAGVYLTGLPLDPEHIRRALHGLKDGRNSK